jgi:hypothetical protein
MGIRIITDKAYIAKNGWDWEIDELDYLLEEHDGETFVLFDGKLHETNLDKS